MQMKRRQPKRNRIGFAIVLAIIMVVILFIVGLALLRLGFNARMQAIRSATGICARTAADAGLTQAIYLMRKKMEQEPIWDNDHLPAATNVHLPDSNASYGFGIIGDPLNGFDITSTGKFSIAQKTVNCKLIVQSLWFGMAVKEGIDVKAYAKFGTVPAGSDFAIRTNSSDPANGQIILGMEVTVPGDVIVGPAGSTVPGGAVGDDNIIILKPGSAIEGDTYTAPELTFPPVTPPDLPYMGSIDILKETVTITPADSGTYDSIRLKEGSTLKISGGPEGTGGHVDLYVKGNFTIDQSAKLIIGENASLSLYLGGSFEAKEGSSITNQNVVYPVDLVEDEKDIAEATTALKIYGTDTCTSIILKNSSDLFGAIYAPNADLLLMNDGDIYGGFVSNSLQMMNTSGFFNYVKALANIGVDDETAYFVIKRWWE